MGLQRAYLAAVLVLIATPLISGARQCLTTIESSSPMFGAPWKKTHVTYSQETQWKRHGDMVKLNLYFDSAKGCLVGVKPTYGTTNQLAVRLGTEKTPDKKPVLSKHILLGSQEKIVSTHFKAGKCVEYFKVSTNQGRFLEIGNKDAPLQLKKNEPTKGAFLGFFKGFTDVVNSNAATGALQQVQLFWVLRECDEPGKSAADIVTESGPTEGMSSGVKAKQVVVKKGAKPAQDSSVLLSEEGAGKPRSSTMEATTVNINSPADGAVQGNTTTTSTTETIIVIDEKTGQALAVGNLGNASGLGNLKGLMHMNATGGQGGAWASKGDGSSNATEGTAQGSIELSGGAEKKSKLKKAFSKLKKELGFGSGNSTDAGGNCTLLETCPSGSCLTSSCTLNGAGKDVITMMCYGTNLIPNPLLDATIGNPCTNLACKLDNGNCSSGPMGIGGFCTGTVVPMGRTAKLHPAGKVWLGYPCIEHKGPLLALLPAVHSKDTGDYDGNGVYVSKAWKVCDCIKGPGLKPGSLAVDLPDAVEQKLNITAQLFGTFFESKVDKMRLSPVVEKITEVVDSVAEALSMFELSLSLPVKEKFPLKALLPEIEVNVTELPVIKASVIGMQMPEVLAQWATAFATKAPLKKYIVSQSKLNALRAFVPGFEVPSVLVANVSAPLMKTGIGMDMPVFTIPDESLASVALLLPNITSLPMLCVPKVMGPQLLKSGLAALNVHNFTIPSMERVVERLLSIFPPPEWAVSIVSGKFAEVANKWMTGVLMDEPIPVVNVTKEQWKGLSSMMPGISKNETTLVLWNASSLLFTKPRLSLISKLPTLVVPSDLSVNVSSICPLLTPGLPALLVPHGARNSSTPKLTLGAVTPFDLKITIDKLVSGIPGHPAFNITLPGGGSILNFTLPLPLPLAKLGHFAGIDHVMGGGLGTVLDAFAGFDALKKNLTSLAGMHNISGNLADQAFMQVVANNFTGIKLIPGNLTGMEGFGPGKAAKKEEGLAALKALLGPKIAVMKAAKKQKAKILNITLSQ